MPNDEAPLKEVEEINPPLLEQFFKEIENTSENEKRLQVALQFMEKAISTSQSPDFKAFWEVRKQCIELFKEKLSPLLRRETWNKFTDLSKEARRLKELLEEQSEFEVEQIELAIQAIEKDLEGIDTKIQEAPDLLELQAARALKHQYHWYNSNQKELNLLNQLASRTTSLRKELIPIEIRIRVKNQFFSRLEKAGDAIFPRRKILIQEISEAFKKDIQQFCKAHFSKEETDKPLHALREEIKALQNGAKILTLSPEIFNETRLQLSSCWDLVKEKDKLRKDAFEKMKETFKANEEDLKKALAALEIRFNAGEASINDSLSEIDQLVSSMRAKELGRDEVKRIREAIASLRAKVQTQQKLEEEKKLHLEEEKRAEKKAALKGFENQIESFLKEAFSFEMEAIQKGKEDLLQQIQNSPLSKIEKKELEKKLQDIKEIIRRKKEEALLNLPTDALKALQQLRELLEQKKEERAEIKLRAEQYRKLKGSSGLDIAKGLEYSQGLEEEREKLEKIQTSIREIEEKIAEQESG